MRTTSSIREVLEVLAHATSVLITGHVRTDGDSLGSMIALAHLLKSQGIKAFAVAERKGLGGPGFLKGTERLVVPEVAARKRFDLMVTVDCGAVDRLPEALQPFVGKRTVVNIDHHVTNTRFGSLNLIDGKASSAGELVWRLARQAGWVLDRVAAEALWVAIITDTGRFAYDMTRPSTLRCAADLLKYGVRTSFINDKIYASFTRTNMELKRRAFHSLTVLNNGEIAAVTLTGRDFEAVDGTKADAEDVIEIPRNLVGNRVALFFYGDEDDQSETRVSIRTREPLDATKLARKFGGGGHARAAGCTIPAPLARAQKQMFDAVTEWLQEQGEVH